MLTVPFPDKKYSIIYADPPWAWSKQKLVDRGSARAVEKEYATMQPDEIKALPVASICHPSAVLFLWATSPKLPLAFEVLSAWGFTFKSVAFVWVKTNKISSQYFTGMGFYTRQNAEFVLVGTRGALLPRRDRSVHQIVDAEAETIISPVGPHSVKPAEIRQRIERLYDGDRIEMFARVATPEWDIWGLEAPIPSSAPLELCSTRPDGPSDTPMQPICRSDDPNRKLNQPSPTP
jgi:N6-adenosine-specific RNA methylase IME4